MNDYWICDEGRYSYKAANDPNLLAAMYVRKNGELEPVRSMRPPGGRPGPSGNRRAGGTVAGVLSPFLTVEEAYLVATYVKELNPENVLALGPIPTRGADQTFRPTRRRDDRRYQLRGSEAVHDSRREVPEPARGCGRPRAFRREGDRLRGHCATSRRRANFKGFMSASDAIDPSIEDAESEALRSKVSFLVVQDTNVTPLAHRADVVLAGATFAEKAGCYVNADGRLQYSEAALPPRDGSLPDLDLLAILLHRPGGGPVDSSTVLAEIAERIPAFSAAKGGKVPAQGVLLSASQRLSAAWVPGAGYTDSWFLAHGVGRQR